MGRSGAGARRSGRACRTSPRAARWHPCRSCGPCPAARPALDRRGDGLGKAPAAGEDTADESVVDAELAALAVRPLVAGAGVAVHLAAVAGIGVDEDELADVVKQRREHEPVAVLVAELGGETLCGALSGAGMEAEAFGGCVPQAVAPEEVEGARAGDDGLDGLGREHLDRLADAVDVAACLAVDAVG